MATLAATAPLFSCAPEAIPDSSLRLAWQDEFNGTAGASIDASKWSFDVGNGGPNPGWGNAELENYTRSSENVFQDGLGHLVIRAQKDSDGAFTSGRIHTKGKLEFTYGRVEARIKIPYAQGVWPAFWMLGSRFPSVPWPESGEIDILENFGAANADASTNHAAVHGVGFAGGHSLHGEHRSKYALAEGFHVYGMDWRPNAIRFFVDDVVFFQTSREDAPSGSHWPFDQPLFLLLNVAVGGYPAPVGYPDRTTSFPQDMLVDYVRVYKWRG